jgi:O-antigen/teichoic acid export membrane protein
MLTLIKPYIRSVSQIVGWQAFSKALNFFASAWAARCLGPEALGISGMVIAWVSVSALFGIWPHDTLLVREFKNSDVSSYRLALIRTTQRLRLFWGVGLAVTLGAMTWFFLPSEKWILAWAMGMPMLLLTLQQPQWCLMAQENMPANARSQAIGSLAIGILYFTFFRPNQTAGSDLVVTSIGTALTLLLGWKSALKGISAKSFPSDPIPVLPLIRGSGWLFISGIVIYIYVASESPILGWLRGIEELGIYRTACMLIGSAQQFLAIAPVLLYPRFIAWNKQDPALLWSRQCRIGLVCILLGIPVLLAAFFVAPWLIPAFYGEEFRGAVYPFVILAVSKWIVLLNGIFGFGLWAQGRDKDVLFYAMIPAATLSLSMNFLFIPHFGMMAAASVNLASETIILISCFLMARPRSA